MRALSETQTRTLSERQQRFEIEDNDEFFSVFDQVILVAAWVDDQRSEAPRHL
jgi:hypothetical protein